MKTRAVVLAAALLTGSALALGAFDWGGTLDNRSTLTYQDGAGFLQEDKLALWLETELGKGLTLTAQGSYTFSLETRDSGDPLIEHILDVDLLRVEGEYPLGGERPARLGFTAGRFPLAEFSAWVLDTTVDGAQLRFANARLKASLALAFTGLELEPVSTVSMSWADESSDGPLAAPRLLQLAQVELPELFRRQDLRLALLAQEDLRSQDDLIQEGDTVFVPGHARQYDAILAMYHDQALPALKAASFGLGINVTLGLPFPRTSVDHGTALDLARDPALARTADAGSLIAATDLAIDLVQRILDAGRETAGA